MDIESRSRYYDILRHVENTRLPIIRKSTMQEFIDISNSIRRDRDDHYHKVLYRFRSMKSLIGKIVKILIIVGLFLLYVKFGVFRFDLRDFIVFVIYISSLYQLM